MLSFPKKVIIRAYTSMHNTNWSYRNSLLFREFNKYWHKKIFCLCGIWLYWDPLSPFAPLRWLHHEDFPVSRNPFSSGEMILPRGLFHTYNTQQTALTDITIVPFQWYTNLLISQILLWFKSGWGLLKCFIVFKKRSDVNFKEFSK